MPKENESEYGNKAINLADADRESDNLSSDARKATASKKSPNLIAIKYCAARNFLSSAKYPESCKWLHYYCKKMPQEEDSLCSAKKAGPLIDSLKSSTSPPSSLQLAQHLSLILMLRISFCIGLKNIVSYSYAP